LASVQVEVDSYSVALYNSMADRFPSSRRAWLQTAESEKENRSAVACSIADQSPVDGHVQVSKIEFFAPQADACSSFINDKAEHCCLAACVAKQKNRFGGNQL
jgi:hypothetical protein